MPKKAIDVDFQTIEKSLGRGDHQGALEAVTKLEKYIGENWRTQYLTGVALMGLSRWEPAITALGKAQTLNPRHPTAALYLSVALQERGDHARAIQVLDKAQQLLPLSALIERYQMCQLCLPFLSVSPFAISYPALNFTTMFVLSHVTL